MKAAFTKANRYLFDPKAWSWNLPSGWSCPAALECLAKADRDTGKITNGPHQKFKCYSAMTERYPSVRKRLWANYEAVRGKKPGEVEALLQSILPKKAKLVRIHSAGDFFSQDYFDGWLEFARKNEQVRFWAFTKSLPFWVARLGSIPPNLELQASYGGRHDDLIQQYGLKYARVVWSQAEADALGLLIDTNDQMAAFSGPSFALMDNFTRGKKQ